MTARLLGYAYAYVACLGALAFFAYGLLGVTTRDEDLRRALEPIEVSVIDASTLYTSTDTVTTDMSPREALAAMRYDREAERDRLREAKEAFDAARIDLESERAKLSRFDGRTRVIRSVSIMLFSIVVFLFHWRWVQRMAKASA